MNLFFKRKHKNKLFYYKIIYYSWDQTIAGEDFFLEMGTLLGSGMILGSDLFGAGLAEKTDWTVGEIMDEFIKQVPGAPFPGTVDTLKSGTKDLKVTGVVTTMFATVEVIKKAINANANFIIAHEPTFYNHRDDTDWLKNDEVYNQKKDLLAKNKIAVWRNHDYVHSLKPDGVMSGVIDKLGWQKYSSAERKGSIQLPGMKLEALISTLKEKLGIPMVRFIGDLSQICSHVILMPGASGGTSQIGVLGTYKPDVLIVGEISEWETAEYVRDARAQGKNMALVILGHVPSEEPGSAFMAEWVKKNIQGITVTHIPANNSLMFR